MGFALPSHGNLPLERYIGSCLISSCPPTTGAPQQFSPPPPSFALQPRKFQKQFYSSKIALRNLNGPVLRANDQSVVKHTSAKLNGVKFQLEGACSPSEAYNGAQKSNQIKQNPFKEPAVTPAIVNKTIWTIGVPLIAVHPSHLNGSRSKSNRFRKNRKYDFGPPNFIADDSELRMLHNNRSQFSKLAVHTQGVPLIQSSRYEQKAKPRNGNKALCASNSCNRVYRSSNSGTENPTSKNSSKALLPQSDKKESPSPTCKVSECSGVNSDENLSCNSLENSLPRIIKPRKRRKKDRKPNANVEPRSHDSNNNTTKESVLGSKEHRTSVKTSQEKAVACTDRVNTNTALADDKDSQSSSLISKAVKFLLSDEQNVLDHASAASLESFEEILTHEESGSAENVSVSCQCRYCDPSSVIWNINTRGYSPSLVSCVLPFRDIHSDRYVSFPNRSAGPVSTDLSLGRVSDSVNQDSHLAKFPLFSIPPVSACSIHDIRHSKSPPFPAPSALKNSSGHNCRFPPPNFLRPPNPEPLRYRFPFHSNPQLNTAPNYSSPPRTVNVNNIPDTSSLERENPFPETKFSPGNERIVKIKSVLDSHKKPVTCGESYPSRTLSKPRDQFTSPSDFTQRFGFLNVSNFHTMPTANFIDTSRPPPPIPTKREEPQHQIPGRASELATSSNKKKDKSWEKKDIGGGSSLFSSFKGKERVLEVPQVPQTRFSSIGQPFKEQKQVNPWPVFNEEHYVPLKGPNELTHKENTESAHISSSMRDSPKKSETPRTGSQNLEISSEIVTSPNGHRDLEIKFFMTSVL